MKEASFHSVRTGVEQKIQKSILEKKIEKSPDRKREASSEMLRAEKYWKERLEGEQRVEVPMNPRCEIGIVIPVYRENISRLARQIESLKQQKGIDFALVEVMYVVNNGVHDGSEKSQRIEEMNKKAIEFLRQDHGLCIHVIDKSSEGNAIPDCNVGRARNRGVAEMSLRFHENKRNGILLQTDADSWFEDSEYLSKIKQIFDEDLDVIGVAGGLTMQWDPDTKDPVERKNIEQKMERFLRRKVLEILTHFLRDPSISAKDDTHFSGAHMLSRSLESAMIGGLIDAQSGEDPQFGQDLTAHAELHGQKILGKRDSFIVATALRDSDRTAASFKKDFDAIHLEAPDLVSDVIPEKDIATFRKEIDSAFRSAYDSNDYRALRDVFTDANGTLIVTEDAFEELCVFMEKFSFEESQQFLADFRQRNFGEQDQVRFLYEKMYPSVELTDEYLERVKSVVRKIPRGAEYVSHLEKAVKMIQLVS